MKTFGLICFTALAFILICLYNGFIISKLWLWLIVPTFEVKTITVAQSIGVSLFINYLLSGLMYKIDQLPKKDGSKSFTEIITIDLFGLLVYSTILLGIGYIYSLFI